MGRGLDIAFFLKQLHRVKIKEILLLLCPIFSPFYQFPGDYRGKAIPDPIPNSVVKLSSADDTASGGKVGRCQDFSSSPITKSLCYRAFFISTLDFFFFVVVPCSRFFLCDFFRRDTMHLSNSMRLAMYSTALMNAVGAYALSPMGASIREISGLPRAEHPFFLTTLSLFVLLFGLAYFWVGWSGQVESLFLSVAAAGKLSFFGTLTIYSLLGQLPMRTAFLGGGDLFFGALFLFWLYRYRVG